MEWPRFNEDKVESFVVELLRESLSDGNTGYTASDDHNVLLLSGIHVVGRKVGVVERAARQKLRQSASFRSGQPDSFKVHLIADGEELGSPDVRTEHLETQSSTLSSDAVLSRALMYSRAPDNYVQGLREVPRQGCAWSPLPPLDTRYSTASVQV